MYNTSLFGAFNITQLSIIILGGLAVQVHILTLLLMLLLLLLLFALPALDGVLHELGKVVWHHFGSGLTLAKEFVIWEWWVGKLLLNVGLDEGVGLIVLDATLLGSSQFVLLGFIELAGDQLLNVGESVAESLGLLLQVSKRALGHLLELIISLHSL